jgi:hypothetical protein
LGHVVAVLPSVERGEWWGSRFDAVGISATTGEYRFLDLDDRGFPLDSEMALSPGGRWLAYWTTGTPIGSPNTTHDTITGIALYDAVTDDVRRYEIETQHGVSPFALTWIDPDTVSVGVGQFQGGGDDGFSRLTAELLWHATEPAPRPDDRSKAERRHDAWDTEGTLLSPSRTRAAGPALGFADDQGPVEVTPIDPATGRRAAAAATVPDSRAYGVLGWTDEDHVVTYSVEEEDFPRAVALDVTTGEARSLVRLPEGNAGTILWARDLWGSPVVPAEEPPRPVDPRLLPGMVAAVVVLAGLLLVLWRRRVRP